MVKNDEEVILLQKIFKNTENLTHEERMSSVSEYIDKVGVSAVGNFFCEAANIGDLEVVKALLNRGVDPNIANKNNHFPLLFAAQSGFAEVALELVIHGAEINLQDPEGKTPLMYSAANGHMEATKLLIDAGGDVNLQDNAGTTALLFAFKRMHTEVLKYLMTNGADMDIQNNNGVSGNMIGKAILDAYNQVMQKPVETEVRDSEMVKQESKSSTKFRDLVAKSRSHNNQNAR